MEFGQRFVAEGDDEEGLVGEVADQPVGHDRDLVPGNLSARSHSQSFHLDEVGRCRIGQNLKRKKCRLIQLSTVTIKK